MRKEDRIDYLDVLNFLTKMNLAFVAVLILTIGVASYTHKVPNLAYDNFHSAKQINAGILA